MRLQPQPRDNLGVGLVADVDDARHWEGWQARPARGRLLTCAAESPRSGLIDENHARLAVYLYRNGVLSDRPILPEQLAFQPNLRIRRARLNLAQVIAQHPLACGRIGAGQARA